MMNNNLYNNQLQPNAISPQAFSNQNAIQGMFGQSNPGSFTRTVGAAEISQMDQTAPDAQADVNASMVTGSMPPAGVAQSITPTYDLNNQ